MNYIIKRDGRKVQFNRKKIEKAVEAAFIEVDGELTEYDEEKVIKIADYIQNKIIDDNLELSVEQIQDLVENGLMSTKRKDVARAYIRYRYERTKVREKKSKLMIAVGDRLMAVNVQNQNANVDEYSFGGRRGEATNEVMKQYALDHIMSFLSRYNHINNIIYIHDLDSYALGMHNCLSIPFDDLLANGFNTRQTDVRPANSANTALQLIAVIFQLQSLQQFGGVSATHLDWTLVPYVRKSFFKHYVVAYLKSLPEFQDLDLLNLLFEDYDDEAGITRNKFDDWIDSNKQEFLDKFNLKFEDFTFDNKEKLDLRFYQSALYDTIVEVKQAVEAMYHNLNTLQSRAGNQLPFTSINYGTCTSEEGRLVIKALIDGSIKGVGKFHKTSIFPCGIFQVGKGINKHKGDPNYDLFRRALKSTAKRLYPNYANIDWSGNTGYDPKDPSTYFSTMGCRTANGWDINGFGQMKDGRGNICPVTIIMPTIAMMAKENSEKNNSNIIDEFIKLLDTKIHEAKDMLIERFDYICSQDPSSAKFMYENGLMKGYVPEEGIRSALKHGTLAVGQIGLAETLQILIGCDHCDPKGMELAKRIEALFRDRCKEFKEEYKLNFGVYYSPAENLCYTAMKKFKDTYGEIPNVSDKSYFTNSIHVPVWKEIDPFEKIDIESQLTGYSSAGCITYVEFDSAILQNLDAIETIVLYAMDHDVPYFAINVPNDLCLDCGYTGEFNDHCPVCNSTHINQLRRVTGYLTGNYTTAFNPGKQEEVKMRFQHTKKLSDQLQR